MKRGKKPTVRQSKAIQAIGLNHKEWLFLKHPSGQNMIIIHRYTGQVREVPNGN